MAAPDLSQIVATFATDFPVRLVPAGEGTAQEQLFVDLGADVQARPLRLELMFLPGKEEVDHLQVFIPLPFAVVPAHAAELARIIAAVNARLPLVGFGMAEREGWVFYRAVLPVRADQELDGEVVGNTGWLAYYLVEQTAGILEDVASGIMKFEDASHAFVAVLRAQPAAECAERRPSPA